MIKNIILINSANFNYLDVNLEKDLFFLGDNGSGKTTVIRAIHYLFSGDVRNLGIPTDKDGFKEYYFRYPNSYMIFVFEEFFIFMYKAGGDIVKFFSKQKFSRDKIIDENSNLYELSSIKKYVKEVNLHKTVRSLSEYRDIIYGDNKRYTDFRFTKIKNSGVFIGLFNEIFNIDKSIIDAKSIKRAIQTTLNYENKFMDFSHDKYLQEIYTFQSQYKFFREFEKQKETIESAFSLKNSLEKSELELHNLLSRMVFSFKKETNILEQSKSEHTRVDKAFSLRRKRKSKRVNTFEQCKEKFNIQENKLRLDIQRIQGLQEEYSPENLLLYRDRANKHVVLTSQQNQLQESFIKLKAGFEDELTSIQAEIRDLEYKKDRELLRELEDKKENKKRFLQSKLDEKIEKSASEIKVYESASLIDIENIEDEIKVFEIDIRKENTNILTLEKEYKESKKGFYDAYENKNKIKKETIETKNSLISQKKREIQNFEYAKEDILQAKNKLLLENKNAYEEENKSIKKEMQRYKTMIEVKPNSFKAFLSEELDGWESELYPVLDASLLDMSLNILEPKHINTQKLFGIELNTDTLKKILTKDEAELKISMLDAELQNLLRSYEESLEKIEDKYTDEKEKIEQNITFLQNDILGFKDEIKMLEEEILTLGSTLENELKYIYELYARKLRQHQNTLESYKEEIKNNKETISTIEEKIREKRREQKNYVKDLEFDFNEDLEKAYKTLQEWLENEQKIIIASIEEKKLQKDSITKDERIEELNLALEKITQEIELSTEAKIFLQKYTSVKEDIDSLQERKKTLKILKLRYVGFTSQLEQKIETLSYEILDLEEKKQSLLKRDKFLKKGIDSFSTIEYDFSEIQAQENTQKLYELTQMYKEILVAYKNKKIDLKEKISKMKKLENTQNEIDISFNLDEYDEHHYVSHSPNILEKIDEIHEYKNKKLEIIKESGNKKFRNFVKSSLPQNMSVFNDSEDKFLSQVTKINKNLQGIDFGVIKEIKLTPNVGDKKSIAKLLSDLNKNVSTLSSLLNENSLFYEQTEVLGELSRLEMKFKEIKKELKGSAISLQDTIDLSLSFNENGKLISEVTQLKNESSTGGSMLLKIAIAISILQLFIKEEKTPFFLIVDEVSRLHSDNQEKLRTFANEKGFGIVFVTPEPTYSKPEYIKYYRFQKNSDDEFEGIELNV